MSTTGHGYHCAPTSTPTTFKETARSETSLAEPPTGGGGVVGSVANPPFGGVAPFRGSALFTSLLFIFHFTIEPYFVILKTAVQLCIDGLPRAQCSEYIPPGQCYQLTWFTGTFRWHVVVCQSKRNNNHYK